MKPTLDQSDDISALSDGALQGDAFAQALDRLAVDADARAQWQAYHVIGDVLRSTELATRAGGTAFVDRLQARIAEEAVVRPVMPTEPVVVPVPTVALPGRAAANGDVFGWKMAAGFASLAAVAAIGWNAMSFGGIAPVSDVVASGAGVAAPAVQARADVSASAGADAQVMLRNAQLDELLAAHNQVVGGAALQAQAGFVRNASFENGAR